MKRNDWLLLVAVSFYSFLFYKQSAGINYVIFNLVLLGCIALKNREVTTGKKWLLTALGCLASAICVGLHGNLLSVIANIISLSLIASLSMDKNSSVIVALLNAAYSFIAAPVYIVVDSIEKKLDSGANNNWVRKSFLIGLPVLVTLIFFFLYKSSDKLFDDLTQKINFDFISIDWIIFTLAGFVTLYGIFYIKKITGISGWDEKPQTLQPEPYPTLLVFGRIIPLKEENFSGTILFVLLNILLLVVNIGDTNFLFVTHELPAGISYSQFVHQGIDALITSIIFAIAIVLFYFRGGLNFFQKNKAIKALAIAWVIQNCFMIFSTACRNARYIDEYGLTFKRIGVYVYLTLAFVGLLTTLIKIIKVKSNNYLFRTNGGVFYSILIILSFPNWDRLVTSYNISHGKIDREGYLFSLNYSAIPALLPLYLNVSMQQQPGRNYNYGYSKPVYCQKIYEFLTEYNSFDWRSWSYDKADTYNAITQHNFIDSITEFDLSGINNYGRTSEAISLKNLTLFKKIIRLNLNGTLINSLDGIEAFPNLKELSIGYRRIINLYEISRLTNLEKLDLSHTGVNSLNGLENLQNLQELNLSGDNILDYSTLYKLKNLKVLIIQSYAMKDSDYDVISKNMPDTKIIKG